MIKLLLILCILIPGQTSEDMVKNYLDKHLKNVTRFEFDILTNKFQDKINYEIDESRSIKINNGYAYIPVNSIYENQIKRPSILTVKLKLYKNVAVAKKVIKKETRLLYEDFDFTEKEVSEIRGTLFENFEDFEEYFAKTEIRSGEILLLEKLNGLNDVKTGSKINAFLIRGNIQIQLNATAIEPGIKGQRIKIKTENNSILSAVVLDKRNVKISE